MTNEHYTILVEEKETIAVRIRWGFIISLFQYVIGELRMWREGRADHRVYTEELSALAAHTPPVEMLRWGEMASIGAVDIPSLQKGIVNEAEQWATMVSEAMKGFVAEYQTQQWPDDRDLTYKAAEFVANTVPAIKDNVIGAISSAFNLPNKGMPVEVALVPCSYEASGAHSHPIIVNVRKFQGDALLEAIFHEIGHELLNRGVATPGALPRYIARVLRSMGMEEAMAFRITHAILFFEVGRCIKKYKDNGYVTIAQRGKLYKRVARGGSKDLSEEVMYAIAPIGPGGDWQQEDRIRELVSYFGDGKRA